MEKRIGPLPLSEEKLAEAVSLRREGYTYKAIGKKLGVTRQAVHLRLLKAGLVPELNLANEAAGGRGGRGGGFGKKGLDEPAGTGVE